MKPFGSFASVANVGLYKWAFSSEQERGCLESPRVTAALSRARPAVIWLPLDGLTPPGNLTALTAGVAGAGQTLRRVQGGGWFLTVLTYRAAS